MAATRRLLALTFLLSLIGAPSSATRLIHLSSHFAPADSSGSGSGFGSGSGSDHRSGSGSGDSPSDFYVRPTPKVISPLVTSDYYKKVLPVIAPGVTAGGAGGGSPAPAPWAKFVDALPTPPVIDATDGRELTIGMFAVYRKVHRDIPWTKLYAYGESEATASYPGPTILAKRYKSVVVTWQNNITDQQHMFSIDYTLAAVAKPPNGGVPAVVHRHGGEQEATYDGSPGSWFTNRGDAGPSFKTNKYIYPNDQPPALLWYHDHTIGMTSQNVAAGLSGAYLLTDPDGAERGYKGRLPSGQYEVPLILADRTFFLNGSINYPNVGDNPDIHPVWVPEYLGDTNLVNGKVWPYFQVERRQYRFRLLNSANTRAYNLRFVCAAKEDYPSFTLPLKGASLTFQLIGTDGGYLSAPVTSSQIFLAVAQRADVVIDFGQAPWCNDVILTNDAPAPYPGGDPANQDTGTVMKFTIKGPVIAPTPVPAQLQYIPPINVSTVSIVRVVTMTEVEDPRTGTPVVLLMNGLGWNDPATETPVYGETEIWNLINATPDAHPMHLHLIQFRLISKTPFDVHKFRAGLCSFRNPLLPSCYSGPSRAAEPREAGWLDTVNTLPDEVTTILVKISQQDGKPFPFDPTVAPGYNWHCHIENHEDNEKMRPLIILPAKPGTINNRDEQRGTVGTVAKTLPTGPDTFN